VGEISVGHSDQRQCFQAIANDHMAVQKAPLPRGSEQKLRKVHVWRLGERYDQEPRVNIVATRAHARAHKHAGATLCGRIGHDRESDCAAANDACRRLCCTAEGGVEMNQTLLASRAQRGVLLVTVSPRGSRQMRSTTRLLCISAVSSV
jgi:hypothetical protein